VIEGLALAAFGTIRDLAQNPLARMVNAYVMEDEARHVAFGRLSLRDYYPQLTQKERDERKIGLATKRDHCGAKSEPPGHRLDTRGQHDNINRSLIIGRNMTNTFIHHRSPPKSRLT